jgi:hypothetical protein
VVRDPFLGFLSTIRHAGLALNVDTRDSFSCTLPRDDAYLANKSEGTGCPGCDSCLGELLSRGRGSF